MPKYEVTIIREAKIIIEEAKTAAEAIQIVRESVSDFDFDSEHFAASEVSDK